MLRINNKGFKRMYVYGGSGIFDSIAKTASSFFSREIARKAASEAAKRATQLAQKAAIETGKKLGEKAVQKVSALTSKSRDVLKKHFKSDPTKLTSKSLEILREFTTRKPDSDFNLNALIDGGAIRIQDYVRGL